MNQDVLTLTPGGRPIAQTLGFEVRSVIVNNFTSSYLRLPDAGIDLPPWVYAAVVPIAPGIRTARASLVATSPAMPGPPVPLSQATLTWSDAELPASSGHLLQQSTITQPQEIASLTSPGNSTGTVTLPVGTQSLAIVTQVAGGDTSFLSLTGVTSSFVYYSQSLGSSAYEIIGVESAVDTVLTYVVGHGSGSGVSFFLTALPYPPPSFIVRTPAPWQVPTSTAGINWFPAQGTSLTWITHTAGRRIRLFDMTIHWPTATRGFGQIKGGGATGQLLHYDQTAPNPLHHNFGGRALAVDEDFVISNEDTGDGKNINGGVEYALD